MQRLDDIKKKKAINYAVEIGMAGRKKSGMWKQQLIAIAAVVMIAGFTFPAWGQNIPFVGRIFEAFEHPHGGIVDFGHLQEFATDVNLSGNIGNVEMIIQDVVFDGRKLYFTYTIESSSRSIRNFQIDITDLGLIIDGEEVQANKCWGLRPGALQQVSGNEYMSVATIYFADSLGMIDHGDVHFNVVLINGEGHSFNSGSWSVSFPIERVDTGHTYINEVLADEGIEMLIMSTLNTPSGLVMRYFFEMPVGDNSEFSEAADVTVIFRILDDLENEIEAVGGSEGWLDGSSALSHADWLVHFGWLDFTGVHPEARRLVVRPYVFIYDEDDVRIREVTLGEIEIEIELP